jgi:GNAT superfamily N-acetyltransferase
MYMDLPLARRLERCEGAVGASFTTLKSDARWTQIAGAHLVFDGPGSPLTQSFGLGLDGAPSEDEWARIEAFFAEGGANADHEISPLAGVALSATLVDRGYRPIEQSNVLVRALEGLEPPSLRVRIADPQQRAAWIACSVRGWAAESGVAQVIEAMATTAFSNPEMLSLYVERDGEMIATGSLGMSEGVALLGGASTAPAHRGIGAQGALLAARLSIARERGCDLAMMAAEPGSSSQRNAERRGFRVAYTRSKWRK